MTESSEKISDKATAKGMKFGFGPHLILDGYDADAKRLANIHFVYALLDKLPGLIGMRKLMPPYTFAYDGGTKPEDKGISGVVIIAESHISIHTYPQKRFLTVDIYSCKKFDIQKTVDIIVDAFSIGNYNKRVFNRGREFPKDIQLAGQLVQQERQELSTK
jgi:S-adenosylmethionine decarboxylase